jgi:hypothetical protein
VARTSVFSTAFPSGIPSGYDNPSLTAHGAYSSPSAGVAEAGSGNLGAMARNTGTYGADQYSTATITMNDPGEGNYQGVSTRVTTGRCYHGERQGNSGAHKYAIYRIDDDPGFPIFTSLASSGTGTAIAAKNITLESVGNNHSLFSDESGSDTQVLTASDSTYPTGGRGGNQTYQPPGSTNFISFADYGNITAGGTTTTKNVQESITPTDNVTDWMRRSRSQGESTILSDSIGPRTTRGRVSGETISVSDQAIRIANRNRFASEAITVADSIVSAFRRVRLAQDSIVLQDQIIRTLRIKRLSEDTLTVIDSFIKAATGSGNIYAVIVSETVTIVDDAGRRFVLNRQVLEGLSATDQAIRVLTRQRLASESISLTDGFISALRRVRSMVDFLELSDGTVNVRWNRKTLDEYLDITDDRIALYIPFLQYTYDVRIRLGMDDFITLGRDDCIRLGMDSPITLGGYN